MVLTYPVKLAPDEDTVLVRSPDFREIITFGEDREDALHHAVGAFEEAIAARIHYRKDIPKPSRGRIRVALPTQTALKVLLYQAMREEGVTKSKLAQRLNWHGPQVDRLFEMKHASRLDQLDSAFRALGRRLSVDIEDLPR